MAAVRGGDAYPHVRRAQAGPPRASAPLEFSQFPNRRAGGHAYDLYCPHTVESNPVVIVAPAADQPLEHAQSISHHLVRAGFIVIAVEPPTTRATYAAVVGEVADEVLRDKLLEAREPGCRHTSVSGAWGFQHGADAVLELARAREAAGSPLAGVVALDPTAASSWRSPTPVFVLSSALPVVAGTTTMLALTGGEACDMRWHTDPCRDMLNRGQTQSRRPPQQADGGDVRSHTRVLARACRRRLQRACSGRGMATPSATSLPKIWRLVTHFTAMRVAFRSLQAISLVTVTPTPRTKGDELRFHPASRAAGSATSRKSDEP